MLPERPPRDEVAILDLFGGSVLGAAILDVTGLGQREGIRLVRLMTASRSATGSSCEDIEDRATPRSLDGRFEVRDSEI